MIMPKKIKKDTVIVQRMPEDNGFVPFPYMQVVLSNDEKHPEGTKIGFLQALKDLGEGFYLVESDQIYGIYE